MAVKIITDSASDIAQGEIEGVSVAPMSISFGERTYHDGVDLSHQRFYEMLVESDALPSTGQVTPFVYSKILDEVLEPDDEAVIVSISGELSVSHQSACAAAKAFGGRVRVVDTRSVSMGERILVQYAARLLSAGASAGDLVAALEEKKDDVVLIALLDTLEYLRRGGRISSVSAGIGAMLSVKPVIAAQDGRVVLLGKARGSRNGRNLLNEQIEHSGCIDFTMPIGVGYTGLSSALLQKYLRDSREVWEGKVEDLPVVSMGSTVGTHAGPGAIALAYFSCPAQE